MTWDNRYRKELWKQESFYTCVCTVVNLGLGAMGKYWRQDSEFSRTPLWSSPLQDCYYLFISYSSVGVFKEVVIICELPFLVIFLPLKHKEWPLVTHMTSLVPSTVVSCKTPNWLLSRTELKKIHTIIKLSLIKLSHKPRAGPFLCFQ